MQPELSGPAPRIHPDELVHAYAGDGLYDSEGIDRCGKCLLPRRPGDVHEQWDTAHPDYGVGVRGWMDVIHRARLGRTTTTVALAAASYADFRTGRRVRPGNARLAVACELNINTVDTIMRDLVAKGLLDVVRVGGHNRGNTEYRLIIGPQLLDETIVLSPDEFDTEVDKIRNRKADRYHRSEDQHPSARGTDLEQYPSAQGSDDGRMPKSSVDNREQHPSAPGAVQPARGSTAPIGAVPNMAAAPIGAVEQHPSARGGTTHIRTTRTNTQPELDVRTDLTVTRASTALDEPTLQLRPISPLPWPPGRHAAPDTDDTEQLATILEFKPREQVS